MLASNCAQVPTIWTVNDEPTKNNLYKSGGWDGLKYNDLT